MSQDTKTLSFAELGLRFGDNLALIPNPGDKDKVFDCSLIGCLPGESIIIGPPLDTGILPRMIEGQRVVIRIKLAGGIALFPSIVLFVSEIPTVMVYLDYPRDIKFKSIRGALRVAVSQPVLVSNHSNSQYSGVVGKIVDISASGARLELTENCGSVGEKIDIKGKLAIDNIQRMLSFRAVIRSKKSEGESFAYGVEFIEEDEDKRIVLLGFIFHAMAHGQLQVVR